MNVAAGVLLIIAAIFNLVGGCGYAFTGALTGGVGDIGSDINSALEAEDLSTADSELASESQNLKEKGAGLTAWGFALFAIAAIMIAGAVLAFMKKNKGFVMVTAILAILAEVVGILYVGFTPWQSVGLLAGVLTFVALKSFPSAAAAAA